MAKEKHLSELFHDTLKDIYFAEKKILTALPKMAKAAQSQDLKAAFQKHEGETEQQVERLEQVFKSIGETPKGKTCDAIMGILDEGKEIMDEYKDMPALDAGLLAAAQAVEHYEISRYGTLKCWASELGYNDAVKLLDATLNEEKKTDVALTKLAESEVNLHAQTGGSGLVLAFLHCAAPQVRHAVIERSLPAGSREAFYLALLATRRDAGAA